ncbi:MULTISPECIES: DUF2101 family protein [Methanothermobacter]|uniref:DUF2101 family protein n=1 Tax=Methanothermobacter wolfeii TaxID=145261 RepID=A0A9E7RY20_METWO|nr:DUF2101 family protein [Methanothermobacter wolfeii]UXH32489.1 DUF2101 family protein [Methanothermobacter wolfeii]
MMGFFSRLGKAVITLFNIIGTVIFWIIELPGVIRQLPSIIREGVSGVDMNGIMERVHERTRGLAREINTGQDEEIQEILEEARNHNIDIPRDDAPIIIKSQGFDPSEKENAVLKLQIAASLFIIASIVYVFNFISIIIFVPVALILVALVVYILYRQIRVMYPADFEAYRDFFFMYMAVGLVIIIVSGNPFLTMAFPFLFFPSLTIFIFAVLAAAAVFLIFRIRYVRDYTFGEVIDAGENTSYVRVDYDIRSNVKPDVYIVENNGFDVRVHDTVKLAVDGSIMSMRGNRPIRIIGVEE